jgi:divalent metal cation (Fe/Co/Zn/Cd) transporter
VFALAGYVTVGALRVLIGGHQPEQSTVGIALVALSVVIMPFLFWAQRRTGCGLGSASAVGDSKHSLLCAYLSAVVLIGLVRNAALGW